ncbi:hypothetical protein ACJ41O_003262 [Fusarium nematophilum]
MSTFVRYIACGRAQDRLENLCRLRDRAIKRSDVPDMDLSDTTVCLHPQEEQENVDPAADPSEASAESNSLFVPRSEDFSVQLGALLDWADRQDAASSCHTDSWLQTAGSSTDRALPSDLEMLRNQTVDISRRSCRVSAEDLQRLQKCIDETKHLGDTLHRNFDEAKDIKRKRSDRRLDTLTGKKSNVNAFMLSRGVGSLLREVTSIDEEWHEPEGEWGMPPPRRPRRMIYRGERLRLRPSTSASSCGKSSE